MKYDGIDENKEQVKQLQKLSKIKLQAEAGFWQDLLWYLVLEMPHY